MRAPLTLGITLATLVAAVALACNNGPIAPPNPCGNITSAATVNASDTLLFIPSAVTIAHGQSVCWQNVGAIAHTVTANNNTSFNVPLATGQFFVDTFAVAGSYPYHCSFHSGMTGTITVN